MREIVCNKDTSSLSHRSHQASPVVWKGLVIVYGWYPVCCWDHRSPANPLVLGLQSYIVLEPLSSFLKGVAGCGVIGYELWIVLC